MATIFVMDEIMSPPINTNSEIGRRQPARDLPARGRIREQLDSLLGMLDETQIFRSTRGTLCGLRRGTQDPGGIPRNYFRIDLQQVPVQERPLNIQYQVSRSSIAAVLVDQRVAQFGRVGVANIKSALLLSFDSGTYPTRGLPGGGTSQNIYRIDVSQVKEDRKKTNPVRQQKGEKEGPQKQGKSLKRTLLQASQRAKDKSSAYHGRAKASRKEFEMSVRKLAAVSIAASVIKKIPFVGLLASIVLAILRLAHGEYVKAVVELASGAASTFLPGFGTAASIVLDTGIAAGDFHREARRIREDMVHALSNAAKCEEEMFKAKEELMHMGMTNDEIERELRRPVLYAL